jgi:RNA recognition motif-containing protein
MYVSNLSFHTSDEDLKIIGQFGAVSSAKVITDRETGQNFRVCNGSEAEAKEAIKGLNNKEIEGRAMSVSVAREKVRGRIIRDGNEMKKFIERASPGSFFLSLFLQQ